ncbi:MAG: hypothetical protein A3E82_01275 [Gammaproteobacteria bacterium RIFCSPHIGHO2_12_FULL_38_11]|nr:MAG: hypothetical protein A3E82_01275 [Gammaproteobacteria bacterium RIFCSPHIGHO2_12_FULL_38_11]
MRQKKEDLCTLIHTAEIKLVQYVNARKGVVNGHLPRDKALTAAKIALVTHAEDALVVLRGKISAMHGEEFNEAQGIDSLQCILSKLKNDARDLDTQTGHPHATYQESVTVFGASFKALRETSIVQSDLMQQIEKCEEAVDAFLKARASIPAMGLPMQPGYI